MERDARRMRGERPFQFAQVRDGTATTEVIAFIETAGGLVEVIFAGLELCRRPPARAVPAGETESDGYALARTASVRRPAADSIIST